MGGECLGGEGGGLSDWGEIYKNMKSIEIVG